MTVEPLQAFVNRAMGLHQIAVSNQLNLAARANEMSADEYWELSEQCSRATDALRNHLRSAPEWLTKCVCKEAA